MPFGLATAPQEFTTLVNEVRKMALRLGISVHMYLDDWLIKANSCQEAHSATLTLLELTHKLGWIINREKSDLIPKQIFTFLGQVYDLSEVFVTLQRPGSCLFRRPFFCFTTPSLLHAVTYIGHYISTLYITYIRHYISALFNLSFMFIHCHKR